MIHDNHDNVVDSLYAELFVHSSSVGSVGCFLWEDSFSKLEKRKLDLPFLSCCWYNHPLAKPVRAIITKTRPPFRTFLLIHFSLPEAIQ